MEKLGVSGGNHGADPSMAVQIFVAEALEGKRGLGSQFCGSDSKSVDSGLHRGLRLAYRRVMGLSQDEDRAT